ncbi:MAG TPA: hypothetical protein VHG27_04750, partial [Xanthobacteraceae bacterium]|nr:hypothetical protein [Xanthobacteraceae bacterium]
RRHQPAVRPAERDHRLPDQRCADRQQEAERGPREAGPAAIRPWAGLDPMMAQAEIENGARLFYRNKDANTWGILSVREQFLKDHPDLVKRVLAVYEEARKYSLANYDDLKRSFIAVTKLPEAVVDKQLKERTELTHSTIGKPQYDSILAAGIALQEAGVIAKDVNVKATLESLIYDGEPLLTN